MTILGVIFGPESMMQVRGNKSHYCTISCPYVFCYTIIKV